MPYNDWKSSGDIVMIKICTAVAIFKIKWLIINGNGFLFFWYQKLIKIVSGKKERNRYKINLPSGKNGIKQCCKA